MSFASVNKPGTEGPLAGGSPGRLKYKSFKKKFLKLRHDFKEKMRESNSLFDEEQSALKLARRLQEQNDQLLDLLLDINDSNRIPLSLRYDLRSPTPDAAVVPALEPDRPPNTVHDANEARAALEEAKIELSTGQITPTTFRQLEAQLEAHLQETTSNSVRSLRQLDNTPHTTLASVAPHDLPSDLDDAAPTGYFSPNHESDYLFNLDVSLGISPPGPRNPPPSKPTEKEKERDIQLRNPVSVHNWLRKHQPSVFLQDDASEAKPPSSRTGGPKYSPKPPSKEKEQRAPIVPRQRGSTASKPVVEQEMLDDEGFVIGGGSGIVEVSTRGKRKRDDEPYRPKGGSGRSSRKKKANGGASARKATGDDTNS